MHPKVRNPLVVCVRRPPAYLWSPWILPIMVCIALPCDAEYALRSPGVPNFRLPCCEGSRTLALTCCRKRERRRSGRWRQSGAVLCSAQYGQDCPIVLTPLIGSSPACSCFANAGINCCILLSYVAGQRARSFSLACSLI